MLRMSQSILWYLEFAIHKSNRRSDKPAPNRKWKMNFRIPKLTLLCRRSNQCLTWTSMSCSIWKNTFSKWCCDHLIEVACKCLSFDNNFSQIETIPFFSIANWDTVLGATTPFILTEITIKINWSVKNKNENRKHTSTIYIRKSIGTKWEKTRCCLMNKVARAQPKMPAFQESLAFSFLVKCLKVLSAFIISHHRPKILTKIDYFSGCVRPWRIKILVSFELLIYGFHKYQGN